MAPSLLFAVAAAAAVALASPVAADAADAGLATAKPTVCTRQFLEAAAHGYMHAQMHGIPSLFSRLFADDVTYIENDTPLDVDDSTLTIPMEMDRFASYYDTTQCGAMAEVVVASPNATESHTPYLIHTRLLFERGPDNGVTRVESVVTQPGDWAFNATAYLQYFDFEKWSSLPVSSSAPNATNITATRAFLQAAPDAYFDRFNSTSVVIPFAPACARLEGGSYTAHGNFSANTCDGYPENTVVTNRRHLIDEVSGVVSIFIGFPGLDSTVPKIAVPDSHLFRLVDGRIRYIHTASHCIHYNCGQNTTTPSRRWAKLALNRKPTGPRALVH